MARGRPLLADGAMGTNLFRMGLVPGEPPERWNELHPDRIQHLHQAFLDAGADILLTNSFGGNRRRLGLHGLQDRCRDLNGTAASLARRVADRTGRSVVIGGSVGPLAERLAPFGPLTETEAVDVFAEQIEALAEGGADVAWIETMSASDEMRAAARAAERVGLPFTLTASFHTAGGAPASLTPKSLATLAGGLSPPPLAIGSNCGDGPREVLASVMAILAADPGATVIAKTNAGLPVWEGGEFHYLATPALMAEYARLSVDTGAAIVGGCCGTTPTHLAAMRATLDRHERREPPSPDAITRRLGTVALPVRTSGTRP